MHITSLDKADTNTRPDGVTMTNFFKSADMGGIVDMGHAVFPPGVVVPWASHDCDEYAYILEGDVCCETKNNGKQKMSAGSASFIPAGEEHSSCNESGKNATVLWILVKPTV